MANEIRLEPFYFSITLNIKKNGLGVDGYYLGDIEGRDFLDFFIRFVDEYKSSFERNKTYKKTFDILSDEENNLTDRNRRIIAGIIESGEYGVGSNIKNENGEVRYQKRTNESNDLPFYFLVHIPKGSKKGILLLQKTGVHSISSIFQSNLKNFIHQKYGRYKINFEHLMSPELAKTMLLDGETNELILTKYTSPNDIFDSIGDGKNDDPTIPKEIKVKLTISSKDSVDFLKLRIASFIRDKNTNAFSIPVLGFEENDTSKTSIRVKYKGSTRTIDLSENMNIKTSFDIERDFELIKNENNHPKFISINTIALTILDNLT